MLTPSVLEHRPEITNDSCSLGRAAAGDAQPAARAMSALVDLMIQPFASIPLDSGSGQPTPFEGFAIVPLAGNETTLAAIRDTLDRTRRKLERLKQLAPEARSQAKYQQTANWLNAIRSNFVTTLGNWI